MKIVQPYAVMCNDTNEDLDAPFTREEGVMKLRRVERRARVSHMSEDKVTPDSWNRLLRASVLGKGDWSVTEHEKVTCEFLVDRGIGYEIVRHRIRHGWIDEPLIGDAAFTQESTRFVNYQKKKGGEAKFIQPTFEGPDPFIVRPQFDDWKSAIIEAERSYMSQIANGVSPQIARSVFPNALASKIIVTYNLRSWRHFFIMRTSAEAHPQMKQVTVPLLKEFQEKIPIFYEDIVPGERQAEAMKKAR